MSKLSQARSIVTKTLSNWSDHNASSMGASLALYAILSLAPILVLAIGVAGALFGDSVAQREILRHVRHLVGWEGAAVVRTILLSPRNQHSGAAASFVSVIALLFGASGVLVELRFSLNTIWNVRQTRGWMGIIRDRLFSFVVLGAIGAVMLLSLLFAVSLAEAGRFLGGLPTAPRWSLSSVNFLLSFVGDAVLFGAIFKFVPERKTRWRDVWLGALVTSLLFSIGKMLIGLYLDTAGTSSFYGAAGSLVALVVWVYYSAQIFLLGAEFTWVLIERKRAVALSLESPRKAS
jgi:membrane protein